MSEIKVNDLDPLQNVPNEALIYVVSEGVDYKTTKERLLFDLQQQISNTILPDQLISIGVITKIGNNRTVPAGATWRIDGTLYSNGFEFTYTVDPASVGMNRIDLLVATNLNTFQKVVGTASPDVVEGPEVPNNTLPVMQHYIFGETVDDEPSPVGLFFEKAYLSNQTILGDAPLGTLGLSEKRGGVIVTGTIPSLGGFQRNSNNFVVGAPFFVHNRTAGVLELQNRNLNSNLKMIFPNDENLFLRQNEIAFFVEVEISGIRYKQFVASSSYVVKATTAARGGVKVTSNEADPLVYTAEDTDGLLSEKQNELFETNGIEIDRTLPEYPVISVDKDYLKGFFQTTLRIVNANTTALNNEILHVTANATITDIVGAVAGDVYKVVVINGLATVGGQIYGKGETIERYFDGTIYITTLPNGQKYIDVTANATVTNDWYLAIVRIKATSTITITSGLNRRIAFTCFAYPTITATFVAGAGETVTSAKGLVLKNGTTNSVFSDGLNNVIIIGEMTIS